MSSNRTYAMIKPHAVAAKNSGKIIDRIEQEGFVIIGMKKLQFTKEIAEEFYAVHKERPFFPELIAGICQGPIIALLLEKDNAVEAWRDVIGATNPAEAAEGTIRKIFGASIGDNAVHGSDAAETAQLESKLVFPELCK